MDIPPDLLFDYMKKQFLDWLRSLVADDMTKKEILFQWAKYCVCSIIEDDLKYIFGEDYKARGI